MQCEPHPSYSAGVASYPDGTKQLVVCCVQSFEDYHPTLILNLDTLLWRQGPAACPIRLMPVNIPYGDTFLIASGTIIYKYSVESEGWDVMPQQMKRYRTEFAATLVPDDYIACF